MRRAAGAAAAVVALAAGVGMTSCSKTPTPGGTTTTAGPSLGVTNPSRSELEELTGVRFPDSVADYRSVQLGPGAVDVTATVADDDVEALVSGSGLPPLGDERVITHSSPVWALNPDDAIAGTTAERDGLAIALEVVGSADPRPIRLAVRAN